jgi:hypothetical protein
MDPLQLAFILRADDLGEECVENQRAYQKTGPEAGTAILRL